MVDKSSSNQDMRHAANSGQHVVSSASASSTVSMPATKAAGKDGPPRAANDAANPTYDDWCAPPRLQNAPQRWQSDRQNDAPEYHDHPPRAASTLAAAPRHHYQLGETTTNPPTFNRHDEHWRYSHEPTASDPATLHEHRPEPHGAGRWRAPHLTYQEYHDERRRNLVRQELHGPYFGRGPKGFQCTDERLADEIAHRLAYNGHLDASSIEVSVKDGEVTLTGTVSHRYAKHTAEDEAERVFGVKDVHNQLRVTAAFPESFARTPAMPQTDGLAGRGFEAGADDTTH